MKFKFQEHFAPKSKTKSQISKWGKILPFFSLTRHLTEQDLWDTTMVNMRTWCGEKVEAIFKNGDSDPLQFSSQITQRNKVATSMFAFNFTQIPMGMGRGYGDTMNWHANPTF